jgi:hypothetical protein
VAQIMLASVVLKRILNEIRQIKKIIVNTIFRLPQKNRKISALYNIDIDDNFIFQRLAIEINLLSERVDHSEITVNKYKIYIYSRHQLPTVTIDFHEE